MSSLFSWRPKPGTFLDEAFQILRQTAKKWSEDDAPTMAAALSYYAIFSIAPILVVAIAIAVPVLGERQAEQGVLHQARQWMGGGDSHLFRTAIAGTRHNHAGFGAAVLGVIALLFGSNGIFLQLYKSLNLIWGAPREKLSGPWALLRQRGMALLLVVVVGFLFLGSLLVSALLSADATHEIGATVLGGELWKTLTAVAETATSLLLFTLLFSFLFKFLPEVELDWGDVVPGAFVSALLFDVGKDAIGFALAHSQIGSTFGAAGSMALFLLWVFYGALIALFGAEFTCVDSMHRRQRRGRGKPGSKRRGKKAD